MKQFLTRYLLLQKRMLKRKSYLIMTLLVLFLVLVFRGIASVDDSMINVAVCVPDVKDETTQAFLDTMKEGTNIIRYSFYDSEDEAIEAVQKATADEAWIIPEDFSYIIREFAAHDEVDTPIKVYTGEENVLHFFLKEMLQSRAFRFISREIFLDHIDGQYDADASFFDKYVVTEDVVKFFNMEDGLETEDLHYAVMPLRGFMALWLLISAIASVMYYIYDEKNGLFIYWKASNAFLREFLYSFLIIFDSSVIALFGLCIAGVFTVPGREILTILFYDVVLAFFAMVLRFFLSDEIRVGVFTPVLITYATVFSPVFIDLTSLVSMQRFAPSYHYLKSMGDAYYYKGMGIFCLCAFLLATVLFFVRKAFAGVKER